MDKKFKKDYIFLDTYVLQQDMRLRLPKVIEQNMNIVKGKTAFDVYMKTDKTEIVLKIHDKEEQI